MASATMVAVLKSGFFSSNTSSGRSRKVPGTSRSIMAPLGMRPAVGAPLQNGGLGDVIRVRNTDTNRIVLGTVMADGRIRTGDR